MQPLSHPTYWRAANILLPVAVFILTVIPAIWSKGGPPSWPGFDKWMHGLTFMLLALWYTGQYARQSYWKIALGLAAYGALIEIGQSMIPYRTAEWADFAADLAGIVAGIAIALLFTGNWSLQAEHWLKSRIG